MSLILYNTITGKKEPFTPMEPGIAKMYVCGPTVYDHSHIGHARGVVVFDVLNRHLKALGYKVIYVRNFTDVDDKIIARANEEGVGFLDLANRHIDSYHRDMDALGALRPDHEPKATEHIREMIADIQELIERGHAYAAGGDVYFDVTSYPQYGMLSNRNIEDMKAGARIQVDDRKNHPLDFALWKESKPDEPWWDSPWGKGRPGWHIECSSMSDRLLGAEFDIHGGGQDLIFPHHENEIAQAAGLGRTFARLWMHNGMVRVNNEKMSKSLGNFFTIKDVLDNFEPEVVRFFLISKHYRSPIDFSDEALREAKRSLDRGYRSLQEAAPHTGDQAGTPLPAVDEIQTRFREAMDDDLNTAKAIGHIFEAIRELNRHLDNARAGQADRETIGAWQSAVLEMSGTLGILQQNPEDWFKTKSEPGADSAASGSVGTELSNEKIEEMIEARKTARANKDWAEADRIRDELKSLGVVLEDSGRETRWRFE